VKPGAFKRGLSFFLDFLPIVMLMYILVGFILSTPISNLTGYAEYQDVYDDVVLEINETKQTLIDEALLSEDTMYESYEITRLVYLSVDREYEALYPEATVAYNNYINTLNSVFYLSIIVTYGIYLVVTKGQTIGRKVTNLEVVGQTTWYNILFRDLLWKLMFWIMLIYLLSLVGYFFLISFPMVILLDILFIGLNKDKRALRDVITKTAVVYRGELYPF
jgi:uncharacterized RDD family membrane protein YckC